MKINSIKRPWQKETKQGTRYNPDPFYQSQEWKCTRIAHIAGKTVANDGKEISNQYCIDCYNEHKTLIDLHTVDHIIPIKLGGSRTSLTNLQSQCKTHHAKKSANEGKKQ